MIAGVSRRDQWENRIKDDRIRRDLNVESVEEAARLHKRLLNTGIDIVRVGETRRRYLDSVKFDLNMR